MRIESPGPRERESPIRFTIASLVNDEAQYSAMLESFRAHGFIEPDVEFLAAREAPSAYAGLNAMLAIARGDVVIMCHQDVRLIGEGREELEARLAELGRLDPNWALAGNAGGMAVGRLAIRITDPHGADSHIGELPARVMSLDENFMVLRRQAGLRFSRDLDSFHFYGADICLIADLLGYSAWVIDFHLHHLSSGVGSKTFYPALDQFRAKWSLALRPRWMQTTVTVVRLTGSQLDRWLSPQTEKWMRRLSYRIQGAVRQSQKPADARRPG
jgi:hypothetical protein